MWTLTWFSSQKWLATTKAEILTKCLRRIGRIWAKWRGFQGWRCPSVEINIDGLRVFMDIIDHWKCAVPPSNLETFCVRKLREICARTLFEAPPQYSARVVQVHTRTNFARSLHIFGCPRTSFGQIFWDSSGLPSIQVLHNFLGHMACSQHLPLYKQETSTPNKKLTHFSLPYFALLALAIYIYIWGQGCARSSF